MQYRKFIFDIEVLQRENVFPDPAIANRPVVSFSCIDSFTGQHISVAQKENLKKQRITENNHTILLVSSEKELFSIFSRIVQSLDPDILTGWYVDFDIKYMITRAKNINFDLGPISPLGEVRTKAYKRHIDYVPGRLVFDLAQGYKRIKNPLGSSLKDVAKEEGVSEKLGSPLSVPEWYDQDLLTLIEYNHGDVIACQEIDDKHKIIDYFVGQKEFAGLHDLGDVWYFSVGLDTLLLRMAHDDGVALPSKPHEEGEWYRGAIVFGPKTGLHPMVGLFDFAKFYPSIIISLNLSPECVDPKGEIDCGGFRTRSEPLGIVPRLYLKCKEQRDAVEAEMAKHEPGTPEYAVLFQKRQIVKDYSNAVHGMTAYVKSRVYHHQIAKKIAEVARMGIEFARVNFNELGYDPIYGDTDSVFVQLDEDPDTTPTDVARDAEKLANKVSSGLVGFAKENFGIEKHEFKLDFDKLFQRIVFIPAGGQKRGARKRYGGWVIWEKGRQVGYLYIRGLEFQRRDVSPETRDLQETVINNTTRGIEPQITINYVRNVIQKIRDKEISLDRIAIRKTLGKSLDAYGGTNKRGHRKGLLDFVRGAIYGNKHLNTNFERGSMVKMLYIKHIHGLPRTDVICFEDPDQLPDLIVDRDKMIDRVVKRKVERILEMAEIPWSRIDGTSSLDEWFGGN